MPDRTKLFHAIVGLGLATGCGDVATAAEDGGADQQAPHVDASVRVPTRDSGARDAARDRISVVDVASPPRIDATKAPDAAPTLDAAMARDAAHDVTIPPPPEIK